jgi:EAL domain-containing protein (putative c-di-GMP-specific phosphodiesterase class I)/GGDEF domain-containing protein/PAS domain-containing protein
MWSNLDPMTEIQDAAEPLDGVELSVDAIRATLDQLTQAVFLYRPIFYNGRIVDLEVVYCNRTALALPLSDGVVPGALASDTFVDVHLALRSAETAWAGGEPEVYPVVKRGLIDGSLSTIRFDISTGRSDDLVVQTSHDHSIDDQLEQSELRMRTVVQWLDKAIVLLEPLFDDEMRVVGSRPLFANHRVQRLDDLLAEHPSLSVSAPPIELIRRAWEEARPVKRSIDNLDGLDPMLPTVGVDLELERVGDVLIHVATDHTQRLLDARADEQTKRRFAATIEVITEAVGIFEPICDAAGEVIDFELVHANRPMSAFLPTGGRLSTVDVDDDDPISWGIAAMAEPGIPVRATISVPSVRRPGTISTVRVSVVASAGQVVVVGADITDLQNALARVTASDDMLRAVLDALAESVRVFDDAGRVILSNPSSIDLLGPAPTGNDLADESSPIPYEVCRPDGRPLEPSEWPLQRGQRGERVDDLIVGVRRGDDEERVCRVAVRPIADADDPERTRAVVVSAYDITESTRRAEQVAWISTHSPLTGMWNRLGLLEEASTHSMIIYGRFVVVWVRLSALESIRPTFGIDTAEAVVRSAATRVAEVASRHDGVAAHVADHEFVVVSPGDGYAARRLSDAVLEELSEPVGAAGVTLLLEPSIGTAIGRMTDDLRDVVQRAQAASWSADRRGVAQERWRDDIAAGQMRRVELLGDIRRALDEGEMRLHYQPKFDVSSRRLVGAEALVRWTRSGEGPVRPDEFIPAVEASGLAGGFTLWAIQRAIREWASVLDRHPGTSVAVNVPSQLLIDPAFARSVELELALGVPDVKLLLEVTERTVGADVAAIGAAIHRFANIGVDISIDDFGTGQSSLAYLRHLKPAEIKVDRTFVAGAADGSDPVGRSVLRACVDIGRAAGVTVCGEGVETDDEYSLLRELGCDTAQGFLLGRPAPIEDLPPPSEERLMSELTMG